MSEKLRLSLDDAIETILGVLRKSPWSHCYGEPSEAKTAKRLSLGEIYSAGGEGGNSNQD